MKKYKTEITLGIIFFAISFVLYAAHLYYFRDLHSIISDLTAQLAYLPVYVFLTSVIIEQLLSRKSKAEMLRKLNTLVGVFYSEIGNELIKMLVKSDVNIERIKSELKAAGDWNNEKCSYLKGVISSYKSDIIEKSIDLDTLKKFLYSNYDLMLNLMANPNLMEHHSFTELILAVDHLIQEFKSRGELSSYNKEDLVHMNVDMERAYKLLIVEWINYMIHLKKEYPYLHNLALRTNPFLIN